MYVYIQNGTLIVSLHLHIEDVIGLFRLIEILSKRILFFVLSSFILLSFSIAYFDEIRPSYSSSIKVNDDCICSTSSLLLLLFLLCSYPFSLVLFN